MNTTNNESIGFQAFVSQARQNISWIDYTDLSLLYEKKGEITNTNTNTNTNTENDYFVKDDTIRFKTKKVFQKYTKDKISAFAQKMFGFYNDNVKFPNIANSKYLTKEKIEEILTSILKNKNDPQFEKFYKWNSQSPLLPEGDRYKFLAYDTQDFSVFGQEYENIIKEKLVKKAEQNLALKKNNQYYQNNQNKKSNQIYNTKIREYNEYLKENHFITYVLNKIPKAKNSWINPYNEVVNRNIKELFKDFTPASDPEYNEKKQTLMNPNVYNAMVKNQKKENRTITDRQLDLFSFFNLKPTDLPSQEKKFPLNLVNRDLKDNKNRGPYIYMGRLGEKDSYATLGWTNERTQKNVYLNGDGVFVINADWGWDFYKASPLTEMISGKKQFVKYPDFKKDGFTFEAATTSFTYKGGKSKKPTKPKVVKKKPVKVINKKRQIKTKYSKK